MYQVRKLVLNNPCLEMSRDRDTLDEAKQYAQENHLQNNEILICVEYSGEIIADEYFKSIIFVKANDKIMDL